MPSPGAGDVTTMVRASSRGTPKKTAVRNVRKASASRESGLARTRWPLTCAGPLAWLIAGTTPSTGNPSRAEISSVDRSR